MEIIINQDIRKFKTKDIGNFSFRDIGFISASCALGYAGFMFQKKVLLLEEVNLEVLLPLMVIPLVFGFAKPFGLTFWQFLKTFFREYFLSPQTYYWVSDYKINADDLEKIYGEAYFESETYTPIIEDKKQHAKELKMAKSQQIR